MRVLISIVEGHFEGVAKASVLHLEFSFLLMNIGAQPTVSEGNMELADELFSPCSPFVLPVVF